MKIQITFDAKRNPMFMDDDRRGWVPEAKYTEVVDGFVRWLRAQGYNDVDIQNIVNGITGGYEII